VEKLLNSGPFGLITDQDGGKSWSSFIESFTHQGESEMLADDWSRKLAASKGTYTVALVMVFFILNLLVQFTYKWSGKISFSWMILTLIFQGFLDESNPSVRGSWSRIRSYLILYRRDCSV
jgi:hypothetical protein